MSHRQQGFTLIELSAVLTIVALIIAGIFIGQNLIRSSQLQSVIKEVQQYTNAVIAFKDKYHSLPGDMSNAESFWGSDASCPNTPYTATPHTKTCNGDGNGHIGDIDFGATTDYELFRAWQELANAGMIAGAFNGISGAGGSGYDHIIGTNAPASRFPGGGYSISYLWTPAGQAGVAYWNLISHIFVFGGQFTNTFTYAPILTPVEALSIDSKMDDGLPATGNVLSYRQTSIWSNCITTNVASTAQYNATYTSPACTLIFLPGF